MCIRDSAYSFTTKDKDLVLRRYRTNACQSCAIRHSCTTGKERLISRWEHEAVLETVQHSGKLIDRPWGDLHQVKSPA